MVTVDARAVLAGACALALFASGCYAGWKWQQDEIEDLREQARELRESRDAWEFAANEWRRASEKWAARYQREQQEAKQRKRKAQQLLAAAEKEEVAAKREAKAWQARFEQARRDPDCAALMQETTCPAFASY